MERATWDKQLADGFLSDRTLDIKFYLILVNANTNTLCATEVLWEVLPTGLVTSNINSVAVPMSLKPNPDSAASTSSVPARLATLLLTIVHVLHLRHDIKDHSPLVYSDNGKVRWGAAIIHIGAQALMALTIVGLIIGDILGDIQLPDVNMLAGTDPNEAGRILSLFVNDVQRKVRQVQAVDRMMGLAWVLATARLVRMLDFDPRLSLVSRTVAHAGNELAFFMLSCGLTVFGYSLAGSVMFGKDMEMFKSPDQSMATLLGGLDGLLEAAADVKGKSVIASIYYWSFVVIVVVLFLNIAVAILVDSYGKSLASARLLCLKAGRASLTVLLETDVVCFVATQ